MKSGKSLELIRRFAPLRYARDIRFDLYQPFRNIRDADIVTRSGLCLSANKIESLIHIPSGIFDIVGIDETHMFLTEEAVQVERLLLSGTSVVASGLDMDYRGRMFPIVQHLMELGPEELNYCRAVCDACGCLGATHTVVLKDGVYLGDGLPSILPDDGSVAYMAHCRRCFLSHVPGASLASR